MDQSNPSRVLAVASAAIVTEVWQVPTPEAPDDAVVTLTAFTPQGFAIHEQVPFSREPKLFHWTWPQHVAPVEVPDAPPPRIFRFAIDNPALN